MALLTLALSAGSYAVGLRTLRVALYPVFGSDPPESERKVHDFLVAEYSRNNPDVTLEFVPVESGDLYDLGKLQDLSSRVDMFEADMVYLHELVQNEFIIPWPRLPSAVLWHPGAFKASLVNGSVYGVPHWLCAEFHVHYGAPSSPLACPRKNTYLATSFYLAMLGPHGVHNWRRYETHDSHALQGCSHDERQEFFAQNFTAGVASTGLDSCTAVEDLGNMFSEFIYSEGITKRRARHGVDHPVFVTTPLPGVTPLVYTDSFVLTPSCTGPCADDAIRFLDVILDTNAYHEFIWDSPDAVPRYLLPATLSASEDLARRDPLFSDLLQLVAKSFPFPNRAVPELWAWANHHSG